MAFRLSGWRTLPAWFVLGLALAGLGTACASTRPTSVRRDPNTISSAEVEEMRQAGVTDLYELVHRRRPMWLRTRSERSFRLETVILVYINEARLGTVEALRGYPLHSIVALRFLDAPQAGLLPGAGSTHVDGAIVVETGARSADTSAFLPDPPPNCPEDPESPR